MRTNPIPPRPLPRRNAEDAAVGCTVAGCFGLGLIYYVAFVSVVVGGAILVWRAVFGG